MFKPKNNFSLLVVDDDPLFQRLLKTVFLEKEYTIHTSGSGEEALKVLKKIDINAAIIDLNLPGMDGMALCLRFSLLSVIWRKIHLMGIYWDYT